jgi:hypothetical protein
MLAGLWDRLVRRRRDAAVAHQAEWERMTPEERRSADESFEDRQADRFVGEHLGGIDPERLVGEEKPPPG